MTNLEEGYKIEVEKNKANFQEKRIKSNKAISLIALIITIIVIIILSVLVIGATSNTAESANKAKFLADLSEIQQAVALKKANNLIPTINNIEADINAGFTKVMLRKPGETEAVDGWVVNLDNIGIKNSTLGNGYDEVIENSEIILEEGAPDIYVYDQDGEVYYAKGFKEGDKIIFSQVKIVDTTVVEPENPDDWAFDPSSGIISGYTGPDVETLIVPNYIGEVAVTEIRGNNYNGITYDRNVLNVVISDGISKIGDYAFAHDHNNLTSITIPNSVTTIGYCAFLACRKLASIVIPGSVTTITGETFAYCDNLAAVTLPTTVTNFGRAIFRECPKLQGVTIPSGFSTIATQTFYNCKALTSITIPSDITSIINSAFGGCSNLTYIKVKSAGPISGEPWGAINADVDYDP